MKIFKSLSVSFILIVVPFCSLFAQKSIFNYVITTKGDTIQCDIKTTLFGKVKYLPISATDDKYIKVTPAQIKEYYTAKDSSNYVPVVLPDNTDAEYLKWVERGHINLYEKITVTYSQYGSYTNYFWYVSKDGSTVKQLKSNSMFTDGSRKSRKGMFRDMIAADQPLAEEFDNDKDFSFDRLQYYVHAYNQHQTGEVQVTGK
jgi:hypothetical protein